MKMVIGVMMLTLALHAAAQTAEKTVPARSLPVPASVSPQMQALIGAAPGPLWQQVPQTEAEWRAITERADAQAAARLPALRAALKVKVSPYRLGGVAAFLVTPEVEAPERAGQLLLHLHGGYRVLGAGEAGTREAILMAGFCGFRVISIDYRMPPAHPFPAALDDALAAYRAASQMHDVRRIGLFGTSAGGALVAATMLRAKAEGLPLPAALALGTPTADLSGEGDSLRVNAFVDNAVVSWEKWVRATIALYAGGRDLRDPYLSPVYGDVRGFPPTVISSGTRDLYLSHAVRMHRALRAAGVDAALHVWEGQSHAQYYVDIAAPETREYHHEVCGFLGRHLAR